MKSPVFLTGATGYIGSQLALSLACRGFPVSVLARNPASKKLPKHEAIRFFQGDISDLDSVINACRGCQYTYHLAAFTDLTCNKREPFFNTNVKGTANVLEASRLNRVKKFIFTSSVSVLGPSTGNEPLTESHHRETPFANDYEYTKSMAEELVQEYNHKGLPGVILNVSRVYGPGPRGFSNGINRLISMVLTNRLLVIPERLQQVANYVFIEDVIRAHLLALDKGIPGEKYIIGGENATYETLFGTICEVIQNRSRIVKLNYNLFRSALVVKTFMSKIFGAKPGITPEVLDYIFTDRRVSTEKAQARLGYPITPLQEGIKKTVAYLKD